MTSSDWYQPLGITPPKLKAVAGHREANTFALLLVALLERGEPMTLVDVAAVTGDPNPPPTGERAEMRARTNRETPAGDAALGERRQRSASRRARSVLPASVRR
jgi:hypothetical protein